RAAASSRPPAPPPWAWPPRRSCSTPAAAATSSAASPSACRATASASSTSSSASTRRASSAYATSSSTTATSRSTAPPSRPRRGLRRERQTPPLASGVGGSGRAPAPNRRKFEFARALGVRYLSADPSPDSFDSLDMLVAEYNIGIAIHPHGPVGKNLHRWYSA